MSNPLSSFGFLFTNRPGRAVPAAVPELLALLEIQSVLRRVLLDDPGVAGWQLNVVLGGDPGLKLPTAFHLGVQLGTEK